MPKKPLAKIVLIGYRGSGKSTVGRRLAERLSLPFIDTDTLIEEKTGITIKEMVEKKGWPYFRAVEKEVIRGLAGDKTMVVAAGGGAVLDPENQARLKENGLVFYLAADEATLSGRIAKDARTGDQRPSLTGEMVTAEIRTVLKTREPIYRKVADYMINTVGRTVNDIVEEIIGIVMAKFENRSTKSEIISNDRNEKFKTN
ncbi:MAG: shikimate kinase [Thermodesulfobacteriota bacterium]